MSSLIASESHSAPRALAQRLQRLGLANLVASLLEAGGAFGVLGAQALYLGEPMLSAFLPPERVQGLAQSLEDPDELAHFVSLLRTEAK